MTASGPSWHPISTLGFLRGRWQADRVINDYRSGQEGSFSGVAEFTPVAGGGLAYLEQGELAFGGHRGPARRSLIYQPSADDLVDVLFADGRPFYRLDLRPGCWQAAHPCLLDQYVGTLRVAGPDSYTEHWRATGPDKDYEMTTTLARIGVCS